MTSGARCSAATVHKTAMVESSLFILIDFRGTSPGTSTFLGGPVEILKHDFIFRTFSSEKNTLYKK